MGKKIADMDDETKAALARNMPDDLMDSAAIEKAKLELAQDDDFFTKQAEDRGYVKGDGIPKAPEKYEYKPDSAVTKAFDTDHPEFKKFEDAAREAGVSQDFMNTILEMGADLVAVEPLEQRRMEIDNFKDRAAAAKTAAFNSLPANLRPALDALSDQIMTPGQFRVFEALALAASKEPAKPGQGQGTDIKLTEKVTQEMLDQWQSSEEYLTGDPAMHRKVEQGYQMLYGT